MSRDAYAIACAKRAMFSKRSSFFFDNACKMTCSSSLGISSWGFTFDIRGGGSFTWRAMISRNEEPGKGV